MATTKEKLKDLEEKRNELVIEDVFDSLQLICKHRNVDSLMLVKW